MEVLKETQVKVEETMVSLKDVPGLSATYIMILKSGNLDAKHKYWIQECAKAMDGAIKTLDNMRKEVLDNHLRFKKNGEPSRDKDGALIFKGGKAGIEKAQAELNEKASQNVMLKVCKMDFDVYGSLVFDGIPNNEILDKYILS